MGTKDKPPKNNSNDELSELLKKYYNPTQDINIEKLWEKVSKKIDTLFHKDILSDKQSREDGSLYSDEERYWIGLEEYINNKVDSLKHKKITDHLLSCSECRKNHNQILNKKKELVSV